MSDTSDKKLSWPKRLQIGYELLQQLSTVQENPKGTPFRDLLKAMRHHFPFSTNSEQMAAKKRLQRFLTDYLRDDFGVTVEAVNGKKGWAIIEAPDKGLQENIIHAASMLLVSRQLHEHYSSLDEVLQVDKTICEGSEHLELFAKAIIERRKVLLNFQEYEKDEPTTHLLHPYALRQYKGRWYVIGYDEMQDDADRYDLHRCQDIRLQDGGHTFTRKQDYSIQALYGEHTFGIIMNREIQGLPEECEPQKIIFRAYGRQPFYLKSCPIHPTQQLEEEDKNSTTFSLYVGFTHDLQMELLSYGPNVEVISPAFVRERMKQALKEAVGRY